MQGGITDCCLLAYLPMDNRILILIFDRSLRLFVGGINKLDRSPCWDAARSPGLRYPSTPFLPTHIPFLPVTLS